MYNDVFFSSNFFIVEDTRQIVYNSVTCLECSETIVSYHRHDYKTCSCPNKATVDGGTDYLRYGAVDMNKIKLLTIYDNDPFEIVRKYACRGGRGINGKEELKYVPLCDMNDEWLDAVVKYGGVKWHIDLIKKEIEYRNENSKP